MNIDKAKAQFSPLVKLVKRGEADSKPKQMPGVWKGKIWIAPDFVEPNAEIARI